MDAESIVNKLLEGPDDLEPQRYVDALPVPFRPYEIIAKIRRECAYCMDDDGDRHAFMAWIRANGDMFPDVAKALEVVAANRSWCTDSVSDMHAFLVTQLPPERAASSTHCMCDESHQISDTVCDWCRAQGRVHFNDPAP